MQIKVTTLCSILHKKKQRNNEASKSGGSSCNVIVVLMVFHKHLLPFRAKLFSLFHWKCYGHFGNTCGHYVSLWLLNGSWILCTYSNVLTCVLKHSRRIGCPFPESLHFRRINGIHIVQIRRIPVHGKCYGLKLVLLRALYYIKNCFFFNQVFFF